MDSARQWPAPIDRLEGMQVEPQPIYALPLLSMASFHLLAVNEPSIQMGPSSHGRGVDAASDFALRRMTEQVMPCDQHASYDGACLV